MTRDARDEDALDRAIAAMTTERADWVDDPEEVARGLAIARLLVSNGARLVVFPPALDGGTWNPRGGQGNCGFQLTPGWQHQPHDANVVDRWNPGDALAMLCGHVYDAVDNDPRNGGDAVMTRLIDLVGPLSVMIQDTPSSGQHYIVPALGIGKLALAGVDVQAGLNTCDEAKPRCNGGHGFVFLAPTRKWSKTLGRVDRYRWVTSAAGLLTPGLSSDSGPVLRLRERVLSLREELDTEGRRRRGHDGPKKERELVEGDRERVFTTKEADEFIRIQAFERLRNAPVGTVANTLFVAATMIGHFDGHINLDDAKATLLEILYSEAEGTRHWDGVKTWDEEHEIDNGFAVGANEWVATVVDGSNPFGLRQDWEAIYEAQGGLKSYEKPRVPRPPDPAITRGKQITQSDDLARNPALSQPDPSEVFLSDDFWGSRPVFTHLRAVAQSALQSPEGVLVAAIALALAHSMPNLVLPACVGVEASLNLMTVICGGSGDGKSVCRKLAAASLDFWGVEAPWVFNPSSGQGVAGQYQYLKKERGLPAQMIRSRYRALAVVEESDTIAALSSNPTSTLSSELRKAAMGESLGFGNIGETQTNLPEHSYRFVMMMCMQPDLAGWLLGDAAGGLPQRFIWACVRDPRVVRNVEHPGVLRINMDYRTCPDPISHGPRARYVMGISDDVCEEVVEAAIQRKLRGDESGQDFDGHALLARLKVAAGLSLLSGRADITDEDWTLAWHILAASNATRSWVQGRVNDLAVKNNVAAAHGRAHARLVEESVLEKQARAKASLKILKWLSQAGAEGLLKSKMRDKLQASERHLIDRGGDSVLDALLDSGQVHFVDVEHRGIKGSRWFVGPPNQTS